MKKNFLAALVALFLLMSCSNDIMNDLNENSQKKINFSTFVGQTKAPICDLDLLKGQGFYVLGYSTIGADWNTATAPSVNFMANDHVKHSGTTWTYDNTKYWPKEYDGTNLGKVSFFAYSPNTNVVAPQVNEAAAPVINYTCHEDVTTQVDLVAAKALDRTSATDGGITQFAFGHKLSKLGFSINKLSDYAGVTIKLYKFEVVYGNTIANSGQFNISTNSWDLTGSSIMGDNKSTIIFDTPEGIELGSTAWTNAADKFLMLIPQGASSFSTKITYSTSKPGMDPKAESITKAITTNGWEMGKQYNYIFNIELDEIAYDAESVDTWK